MGFFKWTPKEFRISLSSQHDFQKSTGKLNPLEAYIIHEPRNLQIYSSPTQTGFSQGTLSSRKIACASRGFSTAVRMASWTGQKFVVPDYSMHCMAPCPLDASNRLKSLTVRIILNICKFPRLWGSREGIQKGPIERSPQ